MLQQSPFTLTNSQGKSIKGVHSWEGESTKSSRPAVIFLHGFGLNKEEPGSQERMNLLCQHGFEVFSFDFSGSGESEGEEQDITLSEWLSDVYQVCEYVYSFPHIDNDNVHVVAHSLGGTVGLLSEAFRSKVLLAPALELETVMQRLFKNGFNKLGTSVREWSPTWKTELGPTFWLDAQQYDFMNVGRNTVTPTFIIHGSNDTKVLLSESESFVRTIANPNVKFAPLPEADHMFQGKQQELNNMILNWLLEQK